MRWFLVLACALMPTGILAADDAEPTPKPQVAERSLESLKIVAEPLSAALSELQKLQGELKQTGTEDAKREIQRGIDAERERVGQLRNNFRDIVGGSEAAEYEGETSGGTSIQEQIGEIVQPVLSEIKEATSAPCAKAA
ncbi:MAG: hypothetical protein OSA84_05910 [Akkermansiaceae bacterium]|nr:hypothetical protein [Akkermansiaceae bacterium]